jgi:hypothetical protein
MGNQARWGVRFVRANKTHPSGMQRLGVRKVDSRRLPAAKLRVARLNYAELRWLLRP